ncbi:unnamed protein product [Effrenium voratum]|uniref:Uncharacterized protein n=1 Tax=Effrenium voratum TaxID=2562239 RepID=A0AA36I1T4_9DINO|nr:unnamed protein product [Effrenium voratum]CAJ1378579.1 unnamed protein product [Effrenium voratum]CAJ1424424.1 unnamed protein product [Effrenium voratum]
MASRLFALVLAALAASQFLAFVSSRPASGRAAHVARAAEKDAKAFFPKRPPGTDPPPPPKASQISMLDIIYIRKYLAGNQKELQKAVNRFSHMDPYMKGRIPAFIEKTSLLNIKIPL